MRALSAARAKALAVDDDPSIRATVARILRRLEYEVVEAEDAHAAIATLADHAFEVVITDLRMPPGPDGHEVVRAVRQRQPACAVLMLTAQGAVTDCVEAMRAGAHDFVTKPFLPDTLAERIHAAVDDLHVPRAPRTAAPAPNAALLGSSPAVREVLSLVEQVAPTAATVLITGETGTGKEVVARLIHGASPRSMKPFVVVNCGAVPESLIESELFGHARGAFTGATDKRVGRFAQADHGTLFLDEIGELPLSMQVRLLRVLQSREFNAVGDAQLTRVDVRVLAATHRDLPAMVRAGQFREDLFYRLNVVELALPPLRARGADVGQLFAVFLERSAALLGRKITVSPEAMAALARYRWPGNVRELENLAERVAILNRTGTLTVEELPREINAPSAAPGAEIGSIAETGLDLEQTLGSIEARLIDEAMRRAGGNKAEAARILGINRTTLVEKLKRRS